MRKFLRLKLILFFFIFSLFTVSGIVINKNDHSKGPLYGKTMYIPYFIYYNFPGMSAKGGEKFEFQYHLSLYLSNDFRLKYFCKDGDFYSSRIRDYENLTVELGTAFYVLKNFQVGLDMRIMGFYGGFLDNIIEAFHGYGAVFPNGGREYYKKDQIYINIENNNNVNLYLDKPAFSFGDMDFWAK